MLSETTRPETIRSTPLMSSANAPLMFPTLSHAQIARIASCGVVRRITRGEVLIEAGQTDVPFFVIKSGEIEIIRPSALGDLLIAVNGPGRFTGEVSMLLGRPAMMRLRASESGEVVQLTRDQMHTLIQTDADVGEVLMRALIYRRMELVARGIGDVLLIGSVRSAATLRIKAFLTRNGHPFKYLDLDRDADVRHLLDRFGVEPAELPVLICRGEAVLRFGAAVMIAKSAVELTCDRTSSDGGNDGNGGNAGTSVRLDDGAIIPARTVIIATGAGYRRPPLANLGHFDGAGVYYSATFMEAQLCDDDEVIVVGGGNSAGQAAVFLARTVRRVHLLVRSNNLSASMSRYLIRRIEETPSIQLRTRTTRKDAQHQNNGQNSSFTPN